MNPSEWSAKYKCTNEGDNMKLEFDSNQTVTIGYKPAKLHLEPKGDKYIVTESDWKATYKCKVLVLERDLNVNEIGNPPACLELNSSGDRYIVKGSPQ